MLGGRRRATPTPHGGPLFVRGSPPRCRGRPHHRHPGLRSLLSNPWHRGLVETLRVYLDHVGYAQHAATALYVHRST
ncbi:helix-turn-helix domain-containing protein [Streptomyces niveus]|uniref:helix-turn-helix domain-containing protein n=1 Tax=Streptomyces niveus TaxID=193462 RepID=UPI0038B50DCD